MEYEVFLKSGEKLELIQPFASTSIDNSSKTISFYTEKDASGTLLATVMLDTLSHIVLKK